MNVGIILAGGSGARVGAECPKQYIKVLGKPIIAYMLDAFQNDGNIDALEVVCQDEWIQEVRQIAKDYNITKLKWIAHGGSTFQESALNGVFNLKGKISSEDIVVISCGIFPMTTSKIIDESIKVCKKYGNAITSEDMVLCTCIKENEYSSTQSILRETIKGISSPWAFQFGDLCETYEIAIEQGLLNKVEPYTTSLYLALGKRIWFSKSCSTNIKITTKEDIDIFEGLLLLNEKKKQKNDDCK